MNKLILFLSLIVSNASISQIDTSFYRFTETLKVNFSDENPYGFYLDNHSGEPYTGWVYDEVKEDIMLFHVQAGKRHGYFIWYKKIGTVYCVDKYSYFVNGSCWESSSFRGSENKRKINNCIIYHFDEKFYKWWYCDPNLMYVEIDYRKEQYCITMTYKYGDDGSKQEIKYKVNELNTYTKPILIINETTLPQFPLVLNSLRDLPKPPTMNY